MAIVMIMPAAAIAAYYTGRKMEETMPLSIFLSLAILTAAGLCGSFQAGCYVIGGINLAALAGCGYLLGRRKKKMAACVLTYGMAAFCVFGILMFIASYGRYLQASDEFTYWARLSKYYYMHDRFGLTGVGLRYLEITAVWDYFSTKIWTHFSIGMMTFGHAMLCICLLLPVFADFSSERDRSVWKKWLAVVLMIWMFPMLGAGVFHGYVTLYADMFLGAAFIYSLRAFMLWMEKQDRFYYCSMLVGLVLVVLGKQAGTILGFILLLIMSGSVLALKEKENRGDWIPGLFGAAAVYLGAVLLANTVSALTGRTGALTSVLLVLVPYWPLCIAGLCLATVWIYAVCRTWNRYLLTVPLLLLYVGGIAAFLYLKSPLTAHQNKLVLFAILKTVMCNGASHMGSWWNLSDYGVVSLLLILGLFGELLLHHQKGAGQLLPELGGLCVLAVGGTVALNVLYGGEEYTAVTFLLTAVIVGIEVLAFGLYFRKRGRMPAADGGLQRDVSFWLFYYMTIGVILYVMFCCFTVVMYYGEPSDGWSVQNARSIWRYMFSYMGPMVFLLGYRFLRKPGKAFRGGYNPFWMVMLLVLLNTNLVLGVSQLYDKPTKKEFWGIDGIGFDDSDVVTFVDSNADNEENGFADFSYQVYPATCTNEGFSQNWYEDDVLYGERMTPAEVSEMLRAGGCTYVYIRNADMEKGFAEYYSDLFENADDIGYDRLYQVEDGADELVSLRYVPRQVNTE